jgi:hypothetical protein
MSQLNRRIIVNFMIKSYAKIIVFINAVNVLFYGGSPEHF